MTKLSSSLPKEYSDDGLGSINSELIADPHAVRVVIALVNCKTIATDTDSGLQQATARILQIEPIGDPDAEDQARELLLNAQEERTGRRALPIPEIDGESGEILKNGRGVFSGVTVIAGGGGE
jgi:hypothetical protein